MKKSVTIMFAIFIATSLFITACKGKTIIEKNPLNTEVAKYLPKETLSFNLCSFQNSVAKDMQDNVSIKKIREFFRDSQKVNALINSLGDVPADQNSAELNKVANIIMAVFDPELNFITKSSEFIAFQTVPGASADKTIFPVYSGFMGIAEKPISSDKIIATLKEKGFVFEQENYNGTTFNILDLEKTLGDLVDVGSGSIKVPYYCATKENRYGCDFNKDTIHNFLNQVPRTTPIDLEATPYFENAKATFNNDGLCVGYSDMRRIFVTMTDAIDAMPKNDTNKDLQTIKDFINGLPLMYSVSHVTFDNGYVTSTITGLDLTKPEFKQLSDIINKVESNNALGMLSKDQVIALDLNVEYFKDVKDQLIAARPDLKGIIDDNAAVTDSLKEVAVGFDYKGGLFPEINIASIAKDNFTLIEHIKGQIAGFMPKEAWRIKDINGEKVHSVLSPFGVGIFALEFGDSFIAASSEQGMKNLIAAKKNSEELLLPALQKRGHFTSNEPTLIRFYLNTTGLVSAMESLQGMLAMYTGGQGIAPELKELLLMVGDFSFEARYKDGILKTESRQKF